MQAFFTNMSEFIWLYCKIMSELKELFYKNMSESYSLYIKNMSQLFLCLYLHPVRMEIQTNHRRRSVHMKI